MKIKSAQEMREEWQAKKLENAIEAINGRIAWGFENGKTGVYAPIQALDDGHVCDVAAEDPDRRGIIRFVKAEKRDWMNEELEVMLIAAGYSISYEVCGRHWATGNPQHIGDGIFYVPYISWGESK